MFRIELNKASLIPASQDLPPPHPLQKVFLGDSMGGKAPSELWPKSSWGSLLWVCSRGIPGVAYDHFQLSQVEPQASRSNKRYFCPAHASAHGIMLLQAMWNDEIGSST